MNGVASWPAREGGGEWPVTKGHERGAGMEEEDKEKCSVERDKEEEAQIIIREEKEKKGMIGYGRKTQVRPSKRMNVIVTARKQRMSLIQNR